MLLLGDEGEALVVEGLAPEGEEGEAASSVPP